MSRRILVTGAAGETGRYTTQLLIDRGFSVRALVHKADERSDKLKNSGAEVFVGDLLDFEAMRHAVEGVNAAYFVYLGARRVEEPCRSRSLDRRARV